MLLANYLGKIQFYKRLIKTNRLNPSSYNLIYPCYEDATNISTTVTEGPVFNN